MPAFGDRDKVKRSEVMTTTIDTASTGVLKLKFFHGGKWIASDTTRFGDVFNPSSGKVIAQVPYCTAAEADAAVKAAHAALADWSATPVVERVRVLYKFRQIMLDRFEEIARSVTREHGKTMAEA